MRRFTLFQRRKIFYVQFVNPETKKRLTARSTGKDCRDEALLIVREWLEKGIPKQQAAQAVKRPIAVELTAAQVLSELKKTELTDEDVIKIEKILKEKDSLTLLSVKQRRKRNCWKITYGASGITSGPPTWKKS